jgi:hypothetical protein
MVKEPYAQLGNHLDDLRRCTPLSFAPAGLWRISLAPAGTDKVAFTAGERQLLITVGHATHHLSTASAQSDRLLGEEHSGQLRIGV